MAGLPIEGLRALLGSGDYSDFTIKCQGTEYKTHKVIIGLGSDFFTALLRNGFKEVQENTIDLREDDPEIVGQLLAFLYTGNYTTPSLARPGTDDSQTSEGSGTVSELVVFNKIRQHILVYQAADKFGIPNLMQQAWDNIKVDCHEDSTGLVLPHHEEILRLVFECTTQRDMRRRPYMIIRTLDCHAAGVSTEEIEKVMVEHEPMAWAAGIRRGCWQCNPKRADAV